jgi:CHAT domain-containing protein
LDRPVELGPSLVVGDPARTSTRNGIALSRLPGAQVEAEAIGRMLGTPAHRLLTGERATRAAVIEHLPDVDLLHLATHGLLNEVAPHSSSLALAGSDHLDVGDLVGLSVTAKLVVLSGCDTGRGATTLGGDLVGLTRALLQAGVEQVVVSLWPVDDHVAAVTMDRFYRCLAQGYPPASALASAQRQVYELSDDDIAGRYASLTGRGRAAPRRRGQIDLPPEFADDEMLPEPLDGRAERYWAPFILVGT